MEMRSVVVEVTDMTDQFISEEHEDELHTTNFSFLFSLFFVIRHLLSSLNQAAHTHTRKESILHGTWRFFNLSVFFFFRQTDSLRHLRYPRVLLRAEGQNLRWALGGIGHGVFFSFSVFVCV
jgi:hypothetical protein